MFWFLGLPLRLPWAQKINEPALLDWIPRNSRSYFSSMAASEVANITDQSATSLLRLCSPPLNAKVVPTLVQQTDDFGTKLGITEWRKGCPPVVPAGQCDSSDGPSLGRSWLKIASGKQTFPIQNKSVHLALFYLKIGRYLSGGLSVCDPIKDQKPVSLWWWISNRNRPARYPTGSYVVPCHLKCQGCACLFLPCSELKQLWVRPLHYADASSIP